jgi:hypothetical protein
VIEEFEHQKLESAADWAIRKIKNAGWHVTKLWKILPPDGSGETEVLFRGREQKKFSESPRLLTAYIPDNPNGEVYVAEGW